VSDCWKGYIKSDIEQHTGGKHITVNHSKQWVNPENGACTNTVEANNRALKAAIPYQVRGQSTIDTELVFFAWMRKNEGNLWHAFLTAIKHFDYSELIAKGGIDSDDDDDDYDDDIRSVRSTGAVMGDEKHVDTGSTRVSNVFLDSTCYCELCVALKSEVV
jgi:hypothetical protein